jgi:hypothetical protein
VDVHRTGPVMLKQILLYFTSKMFPCSTHLYVKTTDTVPLSYTLGSSNATGLVTIHCLKAKTHSPVLDWLLQVTLLWFATMTQCNRGLSLLCKLLFMKIITLHWVFVLVSYSVQQKQLTKGK